MQNTSEDYPDLDGGILVSFITWEKGTLDTCEFEIEGDFDISKLTLVVSQIETSDSVYEIIKEHDKAKAKQKFQYE